MPATLYAFPTPAPGPLPRQLELVKTCERCDRTAAFLVTIEQPADDATFLQVVEVTNALRGARACSDHLAEVVEDATTFVGNARVWRYQR